MKILLMCLFALAALVVALHPLYASEPPLAPFAVCNKGKCVMSEKDYETYRAWHFALIERMQALSEQNSELLDALADAKQKIMAEAFCERHRD